MFNWPWGMPVQISVGKANVLATVSSGGNTFSVGAVTGWHWPASKNPAFEIARSACAVAPGDNVIFGIAPGTLAAVGPTCAPEASTNDTPGCPSSVHVTVPEFRKRIGTWFVPAAPCCSPMLNVNLALRHGPIGDAVVGAAVAGGLSVCGIEAMGTLAGTALLTGDDVAAMVTAGTDVAAAVTAADAGSVAAELAAVVVADVVVDALTTEAAPSVEGAAVESVAFDVVEEEQAPASSSAQLATARRVRERINRV